MARRTPEGPPPPPVVQRIRFRYAKRGRLRFTSHRDFARAFERALRRADLPMGYSAGFSPHPKISYVGASPTGRRERGRVPRDRADRTAGPRGRPGRARRRAAARAGSRRGRRGRPRVARRPDGRPRTGGSTLPGVAEADARAVLAALLDAAELGVERLTKSGRRTVDVRGPIVHAEIIPGGSRSGPGPVLVRYSRWSCDRSPRPYGPTTSSPPSGLWPEPPVSPVSPSRRRSIAVRVAQGPLDADGSIADPLAADRQAAQTNS